MSARLESLLTPAQRAEADAHDARIREHEAAELRRVLAGEPYIWPQVQWRSETPARRRGEPRSSRFADLGA